MTKYTKSHYSILIGLIGGLLILVGAALGSNQSIQNLLNLPGLMMVVGGTLMATLVSRPIQDLLGVCTSLRKLFRGEDHDLDAAIGTIMNIAHWYRLGNLRAAEQAILRVKEPLLRTGAQLLLDKEPIQDIAKVLQWRITSERTKALSEVQLLKSMATFAPAFGMLGTLFGLLQMLHKLGGTGMSDIGLAMSFALVTTLYGLILANMILKPLAMNLERHLHQQLTGMHLMLEGVLMIHQRRHPLMIKDALTMYLHQSSATAEIRPYLAKVA